MVHEQKLIKRRNKLKVYLLLFLAGLGDAITTLLGLSVGFTETRPMFFPFLSTLILSITIFLVNKIKNVNSTLKNVVITLIVLFSYSGFLNNLILFSRVDIFTLFRVG